jgi:hypothetical protein
VAQVALGASLVGIGPKQAGQLFAAVGGAGGKGQVGQERLSGAEGQIYRAAVDGRAEPTEQADFQHGASSGRANQAH